MDDARNAAKLKLLDEILAFASAGSADSLKSKYAPAPEEVEEAPMEEASEMPAEEEGLPPEPGAEDLSEEELKKLLGG